MAKKPRRTSSRPTAPGAGASFRVKVRMYRQGLGDCFLITLPRKTSRSGRKHYYIMIDCGVILGTPNAAVQMAKVVEDIAGTTDGHVDLLLATHAHWDHLSGFVQAAEAFKNLKVDEVWMPWTEDPNDPKGRTLRDDRDRTLSALQLDLARMKLGADTEAASELSGMLDFFGIGAATADGLEAARKLGPVRYCRPSDAPVEQADTDVRLYVLGPPLDEAFLKRTNPSSRNPETYGLSGEFWALNGPALQDGGTTDSPFGTLFAIPLPAAQAMEFFRQRYWSADRQDQWRNIEGAAFDDTSQLALQLDKVTNNTSLVLAIELPDKDVLLFPADAQVGNWLSWGSLKWSVDNNEVSGHDLLERTILYKVGHHGSHNATLRADGLELMKNLKVALIPVDQKMAKQKLWLHMPLPDLVEALKAQADTFVRLDEPAPAGVDAGPGDLFYEVTL